jgi:zinc D-Ala-D-Ala dipeptidase
MPAIVSVSCRAQNITVISKTKIYRQQVTNDSNQRMEEVATTINRIAGIGRIVYDLKYATKNNFTGKRLYDQSSKTYLRLPVVNALAKVALALEKQGLGLKIFDAYRPYHVTVKMWELIHDERYVADPAKGSGHNRGLSVDLTIIHLKDGSELNMGTGFDNFTDTAHHAFTQLPEEILKNRKLLKDIMMANGFRPLDTEWWHYSWPNDRNYDVLDLDFKKLRW